MSESPKLKLVKCESIEDWYVIERAEHDGREWLEPTEYGSKFMCSSRIGDADIEGPPEHIIGIARAIRERGRASFKRCAVRIEGERAYFFSPRNSSVEGETSLAEADALAEQIEKEFYPTLRVTP